MYNPRRRRRWNLIDENPVSSLPALRRLAENEAHHLAGSRFNGSDRRTHQHCFRGLELVAVALLIPGEGANLNGGLAVALIGDCQGRGTLTGRQKNVYGQDRQRLSSDRHTCCQKDKYGGERVGCCADRKSTR